MLEHPWSFPPIACPTRELKSIPVDWAMRLHHNGEKLTPYYCCSGVQVHIHPEELQHVVKCVKIFAWLFYQQLSF